MIAVFFGVLARSVRRVELRPWVNAWYADLAALLVTVVFWLAQPNSQTASVALRWAYVFAKTMFVVLLVIGALRFVPNRSNGVCYGRVAAVVAIYATVAALAIESIDQLGLVQSAATGVCVGAGAALLLARRTLASGWLTMGLAVRSALAIVESVAYGTRLFPSGWSSSGTVAIFLASHSSFDTGAEWVIALGCVLTLYGTIQRELTQSNRELVAAKEVLQGLVDRDSLTGLANRRSLPAVLRESFSTGATILFFDLNDFKEINDSYGHQAGDECLKRFAHVLQASFRPADHVIRYAGDEFVIVAQGVEPAEIAGRIDAVRERLQFERAHGPHIRFSVGQAYLPVNGEPEAALRAADEAMYLEKGARLRHRTG